MNVVVHVFHASNMLIGVVGLPGEKTGAVFLAPKSQGVSVVEMCLKALPSFLKRSTPTSIIRLNHSPYSDEIEHFAFSQRWPAVPHLKWCSFEVQREWDPLKCI